MMTDQHCGLTIEPRPPTAANRANRTPNDGTSLPKSGCAPRGVAAFLETSMRLLVARSRSAWAGRSVSNQATSLRAIARPARPQNGAQSGSDGARRLRQRRVQLDDRRLFQQALGTGAAEREQPRSSIAQFAPHRVGVRLRRLSVPVTVLDPVEREQVSKEDREEERRFLPARVAIEVRERLRRQLIGTPKRRDVPLEAVEEDVRADRRALV